MKRKWHIIHTSLLDGLFMFQSLVLCMICLQYDTHSFMKEQIKEQTPFGNELLESMNILRASSSTANQKPGFLKWAVISPSPGQFMNNISLLFFLLDAVLSIIVHG